MQRLPDWLPSLKEDAMKDKLNVGARRSTSNDIESPHSTKTVRTGRKADGASAGASSEGDFHDRQARTDAAVRTIPGLLDFGT